MFYDEYYQRQSPLSGPPIGSPQPSAGAQEVRGLNPYTEQGKAAGLAINDRINQNRQMAANAAANASRNEDMQNMGMLKQMFGKGGIFNKAQPVNNFQFPKDINRYSADSPRPDPADWRPMGTSAYTPMQRPSVPPVVQNSTPVTDYDIDRVGQGRSPFVGNPFMMDSMGNRINPSNAMGNPSMMQNVNPTLQMMHGLVQQAFPDDPVRQQVALTQAIQESRLLGNPSQLATKYNNYFGIKDSRQFPGTGGSVNLPTTEYIGGQSTRLEQPFSRNLTPQDSVNQYKNLMSGSSRYQGVMSAKTPQEAFQELQRSGYATDKSYGDQLQRLHQRYVSPLYSRI